MSGRTVLTALQSLHKPIEDIVVLSRKMILKDFLRGVEISKWWSDYWQIIATIKAQEIGRKLCSES